jgi:hypothetical protein
LARKQDFAQASALETQVSIAKIKRGAWVISREHS